MDKIIPGIIIMGIGVMFFFNNKNIAKGASKFYQRLYKEKNLQVMFRIGGVLLVLAGIVIIFTK